LNSNVNSEVKQFKVLTTPPGWFWLGLCIVVATLAAYWPVFSTGFIWDDDAYVTGNTLLTAPDGWSRIWFSAHSQSQYFPLVYSTLRCEYALWGLNPAGYHIVNVGLHIVNALLVWALLRRLALPGAWLAGAVFALHPVQVETVAWITELKNTESTLFYLLAVFAWLQFCGGRGRWFYALALALHALAVFAKTTACTLPAALLLVLWLKNEPLTWRRVIQTLPFLLLGFSLGLLSVWWENHLGDYEPKFHLLGGPLDRLLIATHAVWFYAGKIFWPANLTFSYPRWEINAGDWRQYGWLVAGLVVAALVWLGRVGLVQEPATSRVGRPPLRWLSRIRLGRGPAAALIFFVAALSPMLGFIPLYTFYFSYVADHYQYFACVGLIALATGLAVHFLENWPAGRRWQAPMAAALLLVLGILTWRQGGAYRSLDRLWADTLEKNPRSWMAHTNLGRLLAQRGEFNDAEAHYRTALAIYSGAESVHYNYGNLLAKTGRLEEAIAQYRQALQIAPGKADAHNNLGFVLNKQHRTDEAIAEYERAILDQPDYADAYYNLGNALAAEHRMEAAVAAYRRAVRLNPDSELFRKRLQAVTVPAN
jgi:Tfp pilus assembly protein PilF